MFKIYFISFHTLFLNYYPMLDDTKNLKTSLQYFSISPRTNTKLFKLRVENAFKHINTIFKNRSINNPQTILDLFNLLKTMSKYASNIEPDCITKALIGVCERICVNRHENKIVFVETEIMDILLRRRDTTKNDNLIACIDKLLYRKMKNQSEDVKRKLENVIQPNKIGSNIKTLDIKSITEKQSVFEDYLSNTNESNKTNILDIIQLKSKIYGTEELEIMEKIDYYKQKFCYRYDFIKTEIQTNISSTFIKEYKLFIEIYFLFKNDKPIENDYDCFNIQQIQSMEHLENKLNEHMKKEEIFKDFNKVYKSYQTNNFIRTKLKLKQFFNGNLNARTKIILCYFLIMSHIFLAEYFEAIFYIEKIIKIACRLYLPFVYTFFLDLKLSLEMIAGYPVPNPDKIFILFINKKTNYLPEFYVSMNNLGFSHNNSENLNFYNPNHKYASNKKLNNITSIEREIRTLNLYPKKIVSDDIKEILFRFPDSIFISCFLVQESLSFNIYSKDNTLMYKHYSTDLNFIVIMNELNSILLRSNCLLKNNDGLSASEWWQKRYYLDNCLSLLLEKVNNSCKNFKFSFCKNIFLISDENTVNFPFESLSIFKEYPIYRIPSFEFLASKDKKEITKIVKKLYYLIDPEKNLSKTSERLTNFIQNINSNSKNTIHKYITGRNLTDTEWKDAFKSDMFLYFGHGTGKKHLPVNFRQQLTNNNIFIFGCSSSRLQCFPNFKRNGQVMEYLNNVNMFVGCLWNVTDKDLDIFAMDLIDNICKNKKSNISSLVEMARNKMKLRYLNGAAVIVWGIPTYFEVSEN